MTDPITPEQWAQEFIAEFKRCAGRKAYAELSDRTYEPGRYPVVLPGPSTGKVYKETIEVLQFAFEGALMIDHGVPGAGNLALVPTAAPYMDAMRSRGFARSWAKGQAKHLRASSERTVREAMTKMNLTREQAEALWSER